MSAATVHSPVSSVLNEPRLSPVGEALRRTLPMTTQVEIAE
jgi:hypothetical protein